MNKNILVALVVILAGVGLLFWFTNNTTTTQEVAKTNPENETEPVIPVQKQEEGGGTIMAVDDGWNLYVNKRLGFKIKFPKFNNPTEDIKEEIKIGENNDSIYFYQGESDTDKLLEISVADISSKEELNGFVQAKYQDKGCFVEKMSPSAEGVFDVSLGSTKTDGPSCASYHYMIKYSPNKGKVAAWSMGQAVNFFVNQKPVDSIVSDSFEFI